METNKADAALFNKIKVNLSDREYGKQFSFEQAAGALVSASFSKGILGCTRHERAHVQATVKSKGGRPDPKVRT